MNPTRVFILASRLLFAQGVESLLSGQFGIQVVGVSTVTPDVFDQLAAHSPDVVIVEAGGDEQGRLVAQVLDVLPYARVVALTLDDNRIHTYYQQMKQGRRVEDLLEAVREPVDRYSRSPEMLRLFVLFEGPYGQRIWENICSFAPESWTLEAWRVPPGLPAEEVTDLSPWLPIHWTDADVVISLGESDRVAQLLPVIVSRTGAHALLAPVDDGEWLSEEAARRVWEKLAELVTVVFPSPFCSLTPHECRYREGDRQVPVDDPWVGEFATHFGRPALRIECDEARQRIVAVEVERDAPCGCARAVAHHLVGSSLEEAVAQAIRFHQQYPCMANASTPINGGCPLATISAQLMQTAVERGIAACTEPISSSSRSSSRSDADPLSSGGGGGVKK